MSPTGGGKKSGEGRGDASEGEKKRRRQPGLESVLAHESSCF